jgi:hypothetical protein
MPQVSSPTNSSQDLQRIPGIGPRLAVMLQEVGIQNIADLRGRSPEKLYAKLNVVRGKREDPCVLYNFRCAVYFATEPNPEPERLKWWNWKDAKPVSEKRRA